METHFAAPERSSPGELYRDIHEVSSMKLLGEGLLGGKVDFTTSAADGTTFSVSLPLQMNVR